MPWTALSFTPGQIFTTGEANSLQENARVARISHLGSSPPSSNTLEDGVEWWDTSATIWTKKVYAGDKWIPVLFCEPDAGSVGEAGLAPDGIADWGSIPVINRAKTRTDFAGPPHTPKNMLLNGGFDWWRRGSSFSCTSGVTWVADHWLVDLIGSMRVACYPTSFAPSQTAAPWAIELKVISGDATLAGNEFLMLEQPVEQAMSNRVMLGTGYARQSRLSFWFWSNVTGDHGFYISNASRTVNFCYPFAYDTASVWQNVQVLWSSTGERGGFGGAVTDIGAIVGVVLAAGGSLTTATPGVWVGWPNSGQVAPDVRASSGQLNGVTAAGTIFRMTEWQWELGEITTPYDRLPAAIELQLLSRYFWSTFPSDVAPKQNVGSLTGCIAALADTDGRVISQVRMGAPMRGNPRVTLYSPRAANSNWYNFDDNTNATASSVFVAGPESVLITSVRSAASATDMHFIHMTADAEWTF